MKDLLVIKLRKLSMMSSNKQILLEKVRTDLGHWGFLQNSEYYLLAVPKIFQGCCNRACSVCSKACRRGK